MPDKTRLPGVIIIGAQRSGTTRFYNLLIQHPEIAPAAYKEVHFYDHKYCMGIEWYHKHFPDLLGRMGVESSPYYIYHPLAAQRIWENQPEVKIIALLRNPVDRAYSNYQHEVRRREEELSFEDALAAEDLRIFGEEERTIREGVYSIAHNQYSYKNRGYYARQLSRYYKLFPRKNIFLIKSEELFRRESDMLSHTFEFLGVAPLKLSVGKFGGRKKYSKMKFATREMLLDHFAPHNKRLEILAEREFNWSR